MTRHTREPPTVVWCETCELWVHHPTHDCQDDDTERSITDIIDAAWDNLNQ